MELFDIHGNPTEAVSVLAFTKLLSPYFDIESEVPGNLCCQKNKARVDMLLHPKFRWQNGSQQPIAFEIKKINNNEIKAQAQATDYAQCSWNSLRYSRPVSTFVAIYAPDFETAKIGNIPFNHYLGSNGVMLMQLDYHYTSWFEEKRFRGTKLTLNGHTVWSSTYGPQGNFSAQRKFGSR